MATEVETKEAKKSAFVFVEQGEMTTNEPDRLCGTIQDSGDTLVLEFDESRIVLINAHIISQRVVDGRFHLVIDAGPYPDLLRCTVQPQSTDS